MKNETKEKLQNDIISKYGLLDKDDLFKKIQDSETVEFKLDLIVILKRSDFRMYGIYGKTASEFDNILDKFGIENQEKIDNLALRIASYNAY